MKQFTHFKELMKYPDGNMFWSIPYAIENLKTALEISRTIDIKTIAIVKICKKTKSK